MRDNRPIVFEFEFESIRVVLRVPIILNESREMGVPGAISASKGVRDNRVKAGHVFSPSGLLGVDKVAVNELDKRDVNATVLNVLVVIRHLSRDGKGVAVKRRVFVIPVHNKERHSK